MRPTRNTLAVSSADDPLALVDTVLSGLEILLWAELGFTDDFALRGLASVCCPFLDRQSVLKESDINIESSLSAYPPISGIAAFYTLTPHSMEGGCQSRSYRIPHCYTLSHSLSPGTTPTPDMAWQTSHAQCLRDSVY